MASQEAHDWWADVQDERDALSGARRRRPVAVWADDDFDLVPAGIVRRRPVSEELATRRPALEVVPTDEDEPAPRPRGHRFVRASQREEARAPQRDEESRDRGRAPRRIVLEQAGTIDHVMPPPGEEVVRIKGRPDERRSASSLRPDRAERPERRPSRSAREFVEHQPDRIMLWLTVLGFLLILLAFSTG